MQATGDVKEQKTLEVSCQVDVQVHELQEDRVPRSRFYHVFQNLTPSTYKASFTALLVEHFALDLGSSLLSPQLFTESTSTTSL